MSNNIGPVRGRTRHSTLLELESRHSAARRSLSHPGHALGKYPPRSREKLSAPPLKRDVCCLPGRAEIRACLVALRFARAIFARETIPCGVRALIANAEGL